MKKITLLLLVAVLLSACGPKPRDVANAWQAALNKGDIDAALSYLAEDATVTIAPPAEGDGVYNGHTEIRGWYEAIVAGKGSGILKDCKMDGETITCFDIYADEGLKSIGVDSIEGTWAAVIRDGKIQSYTFTMSPESLAKFPPPPEPTPVPLEVLATSASDLVGIWMFSVKLEFKADGTARVYFGSDTSPEMIDEGKYSFDAGKVTFTTRGACKEPAIYEAYVTREGGKPTWLRLQVVGSDSCKDRADMLSRPGKFLKP